MLVRNRVACPLRSRWCGSSSCSGGGNGVQHFTGRAHDIGSVADERQREALEALFRQRCGGRPRAQPVTGHRQTHRQEDRVRVTGGGGIAPQSGGADL